MSRTRGETLFFSVALGLALALLLPACTSGGDGAVGTPTTAASTGWSNTSELSAPPSDTLETAILQVGNDRPRTAIEPKGLAELTDNWIGDLFPLDRHPRPCPPAPKDWSFTHVADLGLTWVQVSVDRMDWEQATSQGDYSHFHINPCQDEMVSLLADNDVTMLHTIVYWDEELNAERPPDLGNEQEIRLYLDYVRLLVRHFKDRIQYYGILNEAYWYVAMPDYLDLIRRVVPIIREEDPEAKIVAGGASALREQVSRDYLFGLLNSDVVSLLDVIILHPLFGESPQYEETAQYYEEYPGLVREIKDVAAAHGFTGEYMTSGMDWRTKKNPFIYEPWEYTPTVAAKYYARAIVMHRGMDIWAGIGGEMYDTIRPIARVVRNLSVVMDGAGPVDLAVQIQTEATDSVSYGFSLPGGDRMLALWTNGAAVDDDPGVVATLTFSGQPATSAVGIDVLHGFQQELVTHQVGEGLVISELLVKDYPIFVRLIG